MSEKKEQMHIGLIGLGKMGGNMYKRLKKSGIKVTGFARHSDLSDVKSPEELVAALPERKIIWLMVPAGSITQQVITELSDLLSEGDMIIDGGNSKFTEDIKHAAELDEKGIRFVDCGVSGGVWGLEYGYGLMAGGSKKDVKELMPVFDALRPEGPREDGFVHAGKTGAGHYAKMVHNGIEYGLMQAYAEGYELLMKQGIIDDVPAIFKAWQKGTVVRSWLLDLLVNALDEDPGLEEIAPYAEDSGEGRWTVEEAVNLGVPAPVITSALFARFASRGSGEDTMKAVAALRQQFGGHEIKKADTKGSKKSSDK